MPWCPKCHAEYREGFTTCVDCQVPLTDRKPEGSPQPTDAAALGLSLMDPVVVYEAKDAGHAAMICEMLRNADIPAAMRDSEELGGLLRVYTGSSFYGMSVLVDRSQAEQAREALQVWAEQDENAPVSEEELTRQALSGLSEEELADQAATAPPRIMESNTAYKVAKWVAIIMLITAALLLFWHSR